MQTNCGCKIRNTNLILLNTNHLTFPKSTRKLNDLSLFISLCDIEKIQHLILHFSGVKLGINRIKDWYSEIISARMVLEYWYATRPFQNGSYQTWSPVSTEPKEPETTLMSLQSFQKAYQKISQLNQFLISMTYGLFTRTAVKIELGHAAIPQLLQSSTKFVLSNMLYFNSTNRLHNNKRDIQHLVFTLQPFLLCGENAGKIRK